MRIAISIIFVGLILNLLCFVFFVYGEERHPVIDAKRLERDLMVQNMVLQIAADGEICKVFGHWWIACPTINPNSVRLQYRRYLPPKGRQCYLCSLVQVETPSQWEDIKKPARK